MSRTCRIQVGIQQPAARSSSNGKHKTRATICKRSYLLCRTPQRGIYWLQHLLHEHRRHQLHSLRKCKKESLNRFTVIEQKFHSGAELNDLMARPQYCIVMTIARRHIYLPCLEITDWYPCPYGWMLTLKREKGRGDLESGKIYMLA